MQLDDRHAGYFIARAMQERGLDRGVIGLELESFYLTPRYRDVLVDFFLRVLGESDDVRKMTLDLVLPAQSHDLAVDLRMILSLPGGDQGFPSKRFHANEHLEATGSAEQFDKALL